MRRYRINNQIRAPRVRAIDEEGKNLGEIALEDAFRIAEERRLDVIEIAPTASPPVVKIMDFGKFKYGEARKEREHPREHVSEVKMLRIGFKTGRHDLELRAKQSGEFLRQGHKVKIDMVLRGREKALRDFARRRFQEFLALIPGHELEQGIKSTPHGFTAILKKA
ncbi:MAG: translation initiation factor IF-3 [Candidatus Sungbacteria bacterium]|uniref:Translation initiation factor IF-3 n=1 Tax=Candidatus Sungiibacteriota bacterium TaxID=2750080 RepID=A0A932YYS4_9BACT|nr:translation initiation factor IF-3 [Candidatus Sungbacteria bacterium]